MKTYTKEMQEALTPVQAIELLRAGNGRFVNNLKVNRNLLQQANETSYGQHPYAVVLSCMDSRTSAEIIFDQGLGAIFSLRVAGNVINEDILGSMEYGCKVAGSKALVVLGHSQCGAVTGACNAVKMGNLTGLLSKIDPAVASAEASGVSRNDQEAFLQRTIDHNVRLVVREIREKSPILAELVAKGTIGLIGAVHDIASGAVEFLEDTLVVGQA